MPIVLQPKTLELKTLVCYHVHTPSVFNIFSIPFSDLKLKHRGSNVAWCCSSRTVMSHITHQESSFCFASPCLSISRMGQEFTEMLNSCYQIHALSSENTDIHVLHCKLRPVHPRLVQEPLVWTFLIDRHVRRLHHVILSCLLELFWRWCHLENFQLLK